MSNVSDFEIQGHLLKKYNGVEKKVLIHAPAGSHAETYAKENNIPFVAE